MVFSIIIIEFEFNVYANRLHLLCNNPLLFIICILGGKDHWVKHSLASDYVALYCSAKLPVAPFTNMV